MNWKLTCLRHRRGIGAEKARYLLNLFATSLAAQDPRKQKLIAAVLDDFERLRRG
jgi:hypothetical protein